jgi:hypothetical protein
MGGEQAETGDPAGGKMREESLKKADACLPLDTNQTLLALTLVARPTFSSIHIPQ